MGYRNEQTLHRRRSTSNQQIYGKVFNISSNKRNANLIYPKISSYPNQNGNYQEHKQQQVLARKWGKRYTHTLLWGCKLVQALWKAVWRFLRKLVMEPPFDPAIPLLDPKDLKSAYYRQSANFQNTKGTQKTLHHELT